MALLMLPAVELAFSEALSSNVYLRDDTFWRESALTDPLDTFVGPMTGVTPTMVENSGSGFVVPSYTDLFYDNIFLIPSYISYGAVVETSIKTFSIWNAHLTTSQLLAINIEGGDGLTLSNPTPAPSTYLPLQYTQFSLTATRTGPPIINANYAFQFNVRTVELAVTGIRAEIWDFRPNWSGSYKISYEYKTEIIKSRSGREQRRALRTTSRKTLEYEVDATGDRMWRLRAMFDAWQDKGIVAPELTKSVTTPSGMAPNGLSLTVDSAVSWLYAGAIVVLRDGDRQGLRSIQSVIGDEVTFSSSAVDAWPVDTIIHPGLVGRVQTDQATSHETSTVATLSFKYTVTPGSELIDSGTPFDLYHGSEVFLKKPNWASAPSITFQSDVEEIDYTRGITAYMPLLTFGRRVLQATFLSKSRDEATEIEQFFHRMKGQQGSFYTPTWEPDLAVLTDLVAFTQVMTIGGTDLYKYYANNTVFKQIMLRLNDGSNIMLQVNSIASIGGNSVITLLDTLQHSIAVEEIMMVCWMPRWRFASDILTIEWLTDEVAQFQIAMQTLEDVQ